MPNAPAEGQIREVGELWPNKSATTNVLHSLLQSTCRFNTQKSFEPTVLVCNLSGRNFKCNFMRGVKGLFSQYTTALFDPRFFFFCSAAYLVRLSLPQENMIILRASIRWLSFKTCIRKALHHNRSVGACLLVCVVGKI